MWPEMEATAGASNEGRVVLAAVVAGLLAGATVFVVQGFGGGLVYRSGEGPWLALAGVLLLPAVAAAGCGALVLHYRSHPRWVRLTAALVAIEAGIGLAIAQLLIGEASRLAVGGVSVGDVESIEVIFGPIDAAVGVFVLVAGFFAIVAVPMLVGAVVRARPPLRSRPWHVAAGAGWLAATTLSYALTFALMVRPA